MTHDAAGKGPRNQVSGTAREEAVEDGLFAGLAHALSNRISTISVIGQTLELGETNPRLMSDTIAQEVGKLEEILRLMRLVPAEGRADPVHIPELKRDLLGLVRHHRELRGVEVEVAGAPDVFPVVADRPVLLRAILAGIVAAARAGARQLLVRYEGDEKTVTFTFTSPDGAPPPTTPTLGAIAESLGGTIRDAGGWLVLSLPSLPETRRREKERGATH
ncbi:MAG: hypothetical protein ABJD07_12125 [Gemmatimonadaceae bacterium]